MLKRLLLVLVGTLLVSFAHGAEPLEPEQAFRFSARVLDANTIEARWQIADEYYLYREKFRFSVEPASVKLGEIKFPAGKIKDDETFGRVETYRNEIKLRLPLTHAAPGNVSLTVVSQGCADLGVCYPPVTQVVKLKMPAEAVASASLPALPSVPKSVAPELRPAPVSVPPSPTENDSALIARLFGQSSTWLLLISFYGFGLLLAFTPCVLPMVPIISGIIVGHGHAITKRRAFVLSSAYSFGMALVFALAGVAAGISGTLLSSSLQNPWVLGGFAALFVVLACSMLGFYELQLPIALQSRLAQTANRQAGSLFGTAVTGALSAIILGPCVTAPLSGALLYIAQSGDALKGGLALFFLALGMGLPLILAGTFSRTLLPHTGPWMEAVKKFFGVLLLATALWIVSPVLPSWLVMLGWAALLIIPAMYLHAIDPLPPQARGWQRFWKGIGIALLLAGSAILLGTLGGARDPLQPLSFLRGSLVSDKKVQFVRVRTLAELDARLAAARGPVLLDFYADWCVSCKEMERITFADPAVVAKLRGMTLLQVDVTANSTEDAALLKRFSLFGPPATLFFDVKGQELERLRVIGFQAPETFILTLDQALALPAR